MKAMVLCAGRGERLRPLTDHTPKPLVDVGGETLLERHLRCLGRCGVTEVVINVSHLGMMIESAIGDGSAHGLNVVYSREPGTPLETAGGIAHALPLLGPDPFMVLNGDIWTDYEFDRLRAAISPSVVLVPNPPHHPNGDFEFKAGLACRNPDKNPLTYAGIAVFHPALFAGLGDEPAPLAPILFSLSAKGALNAEVHRGRWYDIGSTTRLQQARDAVAARDGPAR